MAYLNNTETLISFKYLLKFKINHVSMRLLLLVISGNIANLIISLHHEETEDFEEIRSLLLYAFMVNALFALRKINIFKTYKQLTRQNVHFQILSQFKDNMTGSTFALNDWLLFHILQQFNALFVPNG